MALVVAPRAGAWIETPSVRLQQWITLSLPVRERGLKPVSTARVSGAKMVAPRAGAWIETSTRHCGRRIRRRRSPCGSVD